MRVINLCCPHPLTIFYSAWNPFRCQQATTARDYNKQDSTGHRYGGIHLVNSEWKFRLVDFLNYFSAPERFPTTEIS
jgi:hypothetical protein